MRYLSYNETQLVAGGISINDSVQLALLGTAIAAGCYSQIEESSSYLLHTIGLYSISGTAKLFADGAPAFAYAGVIWVPVVATLHYGVGAMIGVAYHYTQAT